MTPTHPYHSLRVIRSIAVKAALIVDRLSTDEVSEYEIHKAEARIKELHRQLDGQIKETNWMYN